MLGVFLSSTRLKQWGSRKNLDDFLKLYPFELDDFQKEAIESISKGNSVMVAAPTGTGKTVVAEYAVFVDQAQGLRTIYTTPIKALSNQKFRDFRDQYGQAAGLLTGDVVVNPRGRILVMTTEVLRNMLIQTPWELDDVGHVIFDEIHYLADTERGTTWEEAIICSPMHVRLVCLSATIANADEVAAWISKTHRPVTLIKHFERPVPLRHYYYLDDTLHLVLESDGRQVAHFAGIGGETRRARMGHWSFRKKDNGRSVIPAGSTKARREPEPKEIVEMLNGRDMLPAIYFMFSRRDTEESAAACLPVRLRASVDQAARQEIDDILNTYLSRLPEDDRKLDQVEMMASFVRRGIGFHHAGLLPILKQLVEELFNKGLMDVVFATDTLSLGINMPARTVVIGRMTKFDGEVKRLLIPNEYLQLAGRAGRRGIDVEGHVVVPYSPWVAFEEVIAVATGKMHPIASAFSTRYNSVLNLWDPPAGDRVLNLMNNSLLEFQTASDLRELEHDIDDHEALIMGMTRGCLTGTEDELPGYQELLRSHLQAKSDVRKAAQAEVKLTDSLSELPWHHLDRVGLRKAIRSFSGGELVYSDKLDWGVYVGRNGPSSGIGNFIFGETVRPLQEYGLLDYLPAGQPRLDLPESLLADGGKAGNLENLLSPEGYESLRNQFKALDLPDMKAWARSYREDKEKELRGQIQATVDQSHQATEKLKQLEEAIARNPCHKCLRESEHKRNIKAIEVKLGKRDEIRRRYDKMLMMQKTRMAKILQGIATVLEGFDYLRAGVPTQKAQSLRDVFDTNSLIICEMLEQGLLNNCSPADVAEVFSWFAYDRDLEFANEFTLSNKLKTVRGRLDLLQKKVFAAEAENSLHISTGYNVFFSGIVHAWCRGATFQKIVEKVDLSDGDVMMSFNKTLDIMRQVRDMLAHTRPELPLLATLIEADKLMRRGIVEQCYSVITQPIDDEKTT
ncbi:MAG: DEAD/DEAH box helicase [Dehalococcoidia bacterium]|nr:DEAD/DEAH box helicase [Dehalococcoidia bacterium]